MSLNLHILQHVPFENEGAISLWAQERNFKVTRTCLFAGESLPELSQVNFLVVMGGPMNIYEEEKYSWLSREKEFIRKATKNKTTMLGICLGAQLFADVLGAKISKNKYSEIGWFPVQLKDNHKMTNGISKEITPLHWHGDTFDLPATSTLLASSTACKNQAFLYKNHLLALQFHLETTQDGLENLIENCRAELTPSPFIQTEETIRSHPGASFQTTVLFTLLDHLAVISGLLTSKEVGV